MDNQDNQSSWDELARELGADAGAEPAPSKTVYKKVIVPEERAKPAEAASRPKATPRSWDNLAADLGLEVPPPPPEPEPVVRAQIEPKPVEETPARREAARKRPERRGDDRPPRRERTESRDEPAESGDRPRRSRGGRSRSERRPDDRPSEERPRDDRARDDRPREERPRHERSRRPREEQEPLRSEALETPTPAAPEPESPPPAAPSLGVSLWHKIFGSPDQQAERIAENANSGDLGPDADLESRRSDWRREPRRELDDEPLGNSTAERGGEAIEVQESWESESVEFSRGDRGDSENREQPADGQDERPSRRRRRGRGRGRGRGRRPEEEQAGDDQATDSPIDRGEEPREPRESERQREPRGRRRGGRSERPRREDSRQREQPHDNLDDDGLEEIVLDDDSDDRDLALEGDDVDIGERDTPAGHKSIPSWEEAIGMIVEINLSTRTDRRRSSSSAPARGSSSRGGRARGGRRRRKPS